MQIEYKNKKIEKICTDTKYAIKELGQNQTIKLYQRIQEIKTHTSFEQFIKSRIGKCHPLSGKRKGQYGIHILEPYRLIVKPKSDENVLIIEVIDYH